MPARSLLNYRWWIAAIRWLWDPVLAKAEFFEMRADDVWQDDEKHADGCVSPGMPYMPSFDLEATMCLRRTHGVPLPSPDAELDRRSWSPNHGVDSGMEF